MVYLWSGNNMAKKKKNLKKNILVTGGSGFIGSAITKYLVKKGKKVIVIEPQSNEEYSCNKVYPFEKWQKVVDDLNKDGHVIIQIGRPTNTKKLKG